MRETLRLAGGRHPERRPEMSLVDRLKAIIDGMPPDGAVTLPVVFLSRLIEAEAAESGLGRLLTLQEAGEIVGRSPSTVRTWLNTGQLDGFKLNDRAWRIRESALRTFIEWQESGEHEPPTVKSEGPVDLSSWRRHVPPNQGAA